MDCVTSIGGAWVAPYFCAYDLPVEIQQARSVLAVGTSDFLALERMTQSVVYFHDTNNDGMADSRHVVAQADSLNHGIAVHDGYLYASSSSNVYRWPLQNGTSFLETVGEEQVVINKMNEDSTGEQGGGHSTRTLAFDDQGRLYVSVGSDGNIDADSFRSRIRRFNLTDDTSLFPINFLDGEVFADGLRNEVGLAFDRHGHLWGVENSADNLDRDDIGGDITEDNPAEELNRFKEEDAGKHWGYPMCWTAFNLPEPWGPATGSVWAWPTFLDDGLATDGYCRANTIAPVVSMQGHSAPLGITFYEWKPTEELPESCPPNAAFPQEMDGYAFIAFHGSWNRVVPTGYKVVYVAMDESGNPIGDSPYDLLMHEPPNAKWDDGFRPVDVDFDDCGRLLVSSDGDRRSGGGSKIVRMEYTADKGTFAPTLSSTMVETLDVTGLEGDSMLEPFSPGVVSRNERTMMPSDEVKVVSSTTNVMEDGESDNITTATNGDGTFSTPVGTIFIPGSGAWRAPCSAVPILAGLLWTIFG